MEESREGSREPSTQDPEGATDMSANERPSRPETRQEARVEMTHDDCGGRADLIISQSLGSVTYSLHCHDCGYVETWSPDPTSNPTVH